MCLRWFFAIQEVMLNIFLLFLLVFHFDLPLHVLLMRASQSAKLHSITGPQKTLLLRA